MENHSFLEPNTWQLRNILVITAKETLFVLPCLAVSPSLACSSSGEVFETLFAPSDCCGLQPTFGRALHEGGRCIPWDAGSRCGKGLEQQKYLSAGRYQKCGRIVARLNSRYRSKATGAGRFMELRFLAWLPAYLKKPNFQENLDWENLSRRKVGWEREGLTPLPGPCVHRCFRNRWVHLTGLLPCRSSMGFESSLRREGDSLESEALSMSVMKTKRKNKPKKDKAAASFPVCCDFCHALAEERAWRKQNIAVKFPEVFCLSAASFSLALWKALEEKTIY